MIDTAIFDMDGLLVDSEPLWVESMQEVFQTVDVVMSPELAVQTTGLRTVEVVHYWHQHFQWQGKSKEQVAEEIIDSISYKVIQSGYVMEGVQEVLDFFKAQGCKLGLASSSPLRFIQKVLQHFELSSYFDVVQSAEFEPYGKPHPAVYLSCAKSLNAHPLSCVAFEDSINGMVAAKAARMKVVVVPEKHNLTNPKYALADMQLSSLTHFTKEMLLQLSPL
jgi:sugar-phosphatase